MQKNHKTAQHPAPPLPDPATFRAWLRAAMSSLNLTPGGYGQTLGLGKNTIAHFLQSEDRDLRLGTASTLARDLQDRAHKAGQDLGPLSAVTNEVPHG